ncbi:MAG: DUF373 family protein, partial [ANME-2 cluster archaeon]|nr:DUF373 family protein [ANME-2 cluster archaeon]
DAFEEFKSQLKHSLVSGKFSFITYSVALILILAGTIIGAIRFWEFYTRTDIFVGIIILFMVFINQIVWWYVAAGWIASLGRMVDIHLEGENYQRNWPYLFFMFSLGMLMWGASTFILSMSSDIDEYFVSSDTGRNILVLSIVGAVIVSLIGIWISTRTSDATPEPA